MRHQMHLQDNYHKMIHEGTKRIEVRLYDEKRQKVELGDEIEFIPMSGKVDPRNRCIMKVIGILRYQNFKDLFADYPMRMLAEEGYSEDVLLGDLEKLYTPGLQNTYGVVGFRLEKV